MESSLLQSGPLSNANNSTTESRILKSPLRKEALSINALRACVYIYMRQLSSFIAPTLWFIDLTVATCLFFSRQNGETRKYSKSAIFV